MRKGNLILLLGMLMVLLAGCGAKEKTESEIMEDLQNHPNFYSGQDVIIEELKIEKRQTDKENKTDKVYTTVIASNDEVECHLGYYLEYELYNEGWFLDNVESYMENDWYFVPKKEAGQNMADQEIAECYYSGYEYIDKNVNLEEGYCSYQYECYDHYLLCKQVFQVEISYDFSEYEGEWYGNKPKVAKISEDWSAIEGQWELETEISPFTFADTSDYIKLDLTMNITAADESGFYAEVYDEGKLIFSDTVAFEDDGELGEGFKVSGRKENLRGREYDWDRYIWVNPNSISLGDYEIECFEKVGDALETSAQQEIETDIFDDEEYRAKEPFDIPDWYEYGVVLVNGDTVCYALKEGQWFADGTCSEYILVTEFDGEDFVSMKTYDIFLDTERAKDYTKECVESDGKNLGYEKGQASFSYYDNVVCTILSEGYAKRFYHVSEGELTLSKCIEDYIVYDGGVTYK